MNKIYHGTVMFKFHVNIMLHEYGNYSNFDAVKGKR